MTINMILRQRRIRSMENPTELKKNNSEQVRKVLGRAFWSIVKHYDLNQREQAIVLGIKENRSRLNSLKSKKSIPEDPDKELRVSHLLGIHKNLRILFPHNREVAYKWFKTQRAQFNNMSAMEYIASGPEFESMLRLAAVRRFLDQVRVSG